MNNKELLCLLLFISFASSQFFNDDKIRIPDCEQNEIWDGQSCFINPKPGKCKNGKYLNLLVGKCVCPYGYKQSGDRCKSLKPIDQPNSSPISKKIYEKALKCQKDSGCTTSQTYPSFSLNQELKKFLDERHFQNGTQQKYFQYEKSLQQLRKQMDNNYTLSSYTQFVKGQLEKSRNVSAASASSDRTDLVNDLINQGKKTQGKASAKAKNLRSQTRFSSSSNSKYSNVNEGNIQVTEGTGLFKIKLQIDGLYKLAAFDLNGTQVTYCWNFTFPSGVVVKELHAKNGFLVVILENYQTEYVDVFKLELSLTQLRPNCWLGGFYHGYSKKGFLVGSRQAEGNLMIVTQSLKSRNQNLVFYFTENQKPFQKVSYQNMLLGIVSQFTQEFVLHVWCLKLEFKSDQYLFAQYYQTHFADVLSFEKQHLFIGSSSVSNQEHQILVIHNISPTDSSWLVRTTKKRTGVLLHNFDLDEYENRLRVFARTKLYPVTHFYSYGLPLNENPNPTIENSRSSVLGQKLQFVLFFDVYACLLYKSQIIVYDTYNPHWSKSYQQSDPLSVIFKFSNNGHIIGFGKTKILLQPFSIMFKLTGSDLKQLHTEYPPKQFIIAKNSLVTFANNLKWQYQSILIKQSTLSVAFGLKNSGLSSIFVLGMYYMYADPYGCLQPVGPTSCQENPSAPFNPNLYPHKNNILKWSQQPNRFAIVEAANSRFFLYSSSNDYLQARSLTQKSPDPLFVLPAGSEHII